MNNSSFLGSEIPVLVVLPYVRKASLYYIVRGAPELDLLERWRKDGIPGSFTTESHFIP
jgi:hypothetical protein